LTQISFEVSSKKTASSLTVHSGQLNSPQRKKTMRTYTIGQNSAGTRKSPIAPSHPSASNLLGPFFAYSEYSAVNLPSSPSATNLLGAPHVCHPNIPQSAIRNPQFGSHSPQKRFSHPKLGTNRVQRCAPTTSCRVRTEFEPSPAEFPPSSNRVLPSPTRFNRVLPSPNRAQPIHL
jgi:hypothetical protein